MRFSRGKALEPSLFEAVGPRAEVKKRCRAAEFRCLYLAARRFTSKQMIPIARYLHCRRSFSWLQPGSYRKLRCEAAAKLE